jgi:hypothetical protein
MPYIPCTQNIISLCVPAGTDVNPRRFKSLECLTIYNAYTSTEKTRAIASLQRLRTLSIQFGKKPHSVREPLIDLSILPSLQALLLVTPEAWTPPTFLCTGFSGSVSKLAMVGAFSFPNFTHFTSLLHRLSSDNIECLSLKDLILYRSSNIGSSSWPLMLGLRSFECIGTGPVYFKHMSWFNVRKISLEYAEVIAMKVISRILRTAQQLISFSIVTHSR